MAISVAHACRGCSPDDPHAELAARVRHMYVCEELSTYRIAEIVRIGRVRVTRLLHLHGVAVKPRGAGRRRPRRVESPVSDRRLRELYVRRRFLRRWRAELRAADQAG